MDNEYLELKKKYSSFYDNVVEKLKSHDFLPNKLKVLYSINNDLFLEILTKDNTKLEQSNLWNKRYQNIKSELRVHSFYPGFDNDILYTKFKNYLLNLNSEKSSSLLKCYFISKVSKEPKINNNLSKLFSFLLYHYYLKAKNRLKLLNFIIREYQLKNEEEITNLRLEIPHERFKMEYPKFYEQIINDYNAIMDKWLIVSKRPDLLKDLSNELISEILDEVYIRLTNDLSLLDLLNDFEMGKLDFKNEKDYIENEHMAHEILKNQIFQVYRPYFFLIEFALADWGNDTTLWEKKYNLLEKKAQDVYLEEFRKARDLRIENEILKKNKKEGQGGSQKNRGRKSKYTKEKLIESIKEIDDYNKISEHALAKQTGIPYSTLIENLKKYDIDHTKI